MAEQTEAHNPWKTAVLAGMASYLDAAALVAGGIAIGGLYTSALGLSPGAVGRILGLQTFMFAIGALFGGRVGDRLGRRVVFTLSLILYVVGAVLLTVATGVAFLYVGVIAIGLAIGADLPVSLSMINEEAPEGEKGKLVAFTQVLWTLGIVVPVGLSSVVGGMGQTGGRILFGHLVVVSLIVLVLRWTMRESVEWAAARQARDSEPRGGEVTVRFSQMSQLFRPPVLLAVLATAIFYTAWNLGANTYGQFSTFLWTKLTGGEVQTYSFYSLFGFPLGFVAAYIFMRVADRPSRRTWFLLGALLNVTAWTILVVVGPTQATILLGFFLTAVGGSFAGETIYKVWSQELVPTLLRSTMQGVTIAFARVVSALFAFVTPSLALANPRLLFGLLLALSLVASVIGLFWIPRLPRARAIEEPPVIVGERLQHSS